MPASKFKAVRVTLPVAVRAPVDEVFPLACPIEEYKWIPGWKCRIVHCPNDRAELGTIFGEFSSAPLLMGVPWGQTVWRAVHFDSENHQIHYALSNKHAAILYRMEFESDGQGGTTGTLDFSYRAITARGNRLVSNNLESKLRLMISTLRLMLIHYAENGVLISASEVRKQVASNKGITFSVKLLLLLNRVIRSRFKDENRARFLAGN